MIMNDHFYKQENSDSEISNNNSVNKTFVKKKSIVPIVIEYNYSNLMYNVKRHYFTHHDV